MSRPSFATCAGTSTTPRKEMLSGTGSSQRLQQCEAGESGTADKLLLLHSHVYYMVELFEEHDDAEALSALKKLEEECF